MRKNYKPRGKQEASKKTNFKGRKQEFVDDPNSVKAALAGKPSANDAKWYIAKDQLAYDVASLSFNNPTGAPLPIYAYGGSGANFRCPGFMGLWTLPSVGVSVGPTSPINVAAKNFYSFIRHANSGHANYESPDLMMYLVAMDSLFSWYATLRRLYGIARVYSQVNRYFGTNMIMALGFDAQDVLSHLADLRAYVNMLAIRMSAFVVPDTMSYYTRHSWMYSNIFKDADTRKSQMYAYIPIALYKYVEGSNPDVAGRLVLTNACGAVNENYGVVPRASMSYQDLLNVTETLIQPLIQSEDIAIMSGDILKAYGDHVYRFDLIPEDYVIMPIYSEEILSQIHNTTIVGCGLCDDSAGSAYGYGSMEVRQDISTSTGGNIICSPFVKGNCRTNFDHLVDMYKDTPTPEEIMVATRNMMFTQRVGSGSAPFLYQVTTCASDMVMFTTVDITDSNSITVTVYDGSGQIANKCINYFGKFNQSPLLYDQGTDPGTFGDVYGDLNNTISINNATLRRMHECALMSMFALQLEGTADK